MKPPNFDIEARIKDDFGHSKGVLRFLSNGPENIDSQSITNKIFKFSPSSLILNINVVKEIGKTAILLHIEKSLEILTGKYENNGHVTRLTNLLKSYIQIGKFEIIGEPPNQDVYPEQVNTSLYYFRSLLGQDQNMVILLEFNNDDYAREFLNFIKPMIENLPERVKIYGFISNKILKADKLHYQFNSDYYWNHPSELGLDVYYLVQMGTPQLIEFLTIEEISLILRLWNLTDIAIPAFEAAINILPKYHPLELAFLAQSHVLEFGINNQDHWHAQYKLYRELAYHLSKIGKMDEARRFQGKALEIIDNSAIPNFETIKLKGAIWREKAQLAKKDKKLLDAILVLEFERELYRQTDQTNIQADLSANAYNLGSCFREIGDHEKAIQQFNVSIVIEKELGHTDGEVESRLQLARTFIDLQDNKSAIRQFNIIEKILPSEPRGRSQYVKGISFAYLTYLHKYFGDIEKAKNYAQSAKYIFLNLGANEDLQKLDTILKD